MSHELTIRMNGAAEMAFVGETPWHKLGQQLVEGASIEEWIKAAGMDWKIQRAKVRYAVAHGASADAYRSIDDQHVLLRSDTKDALGIVSDAYKIVQPAAVLEFFRNLVEGHGYKLHTAGTLFGGRKFWALAKVAEGAVVGSDKIGAYVLLSSSCDGSSASEGRFTAIRVVCNNTFTMATSGNAAKAKISHRSHFNVAQMQERMGLVQASFSDYLNDARSLAAKRISDRDAAALVRKLLRPQEVAAEEAKQAIAIAATQGSADFARLIAGTAKVSTELQAGDDAKTRAPKGEAEILALFRGHGRGAQMAGSAGTAWGLLNAVTEFVDHKAQAKTVDHRVDRAFFGTGDELKTRAMDLMKAI
jgi:phage/plasmid-like protein (TIGR03299 family)